jgi:hypothetical protein
LRFASALLIFATIVHAGVSFERSASGEAFLARVSGGIVSAEATRLETNRQTRDGARRDWLEFEGAQRTIGSGSRPVPGVSHYVIGDDRAKWRLNVARYAEARFPSIYDGIDLRYHANANQIEFDFEISPGGDASVIRMLFRKPARIANDATLHTEETVLRNPVAWQMVEDVRQVVAVAYVKRGNRRVGFKLGPYRHDLPLTIDPVVDFATFLGGSGNESATKVVVGIDGGIYVAGTTESADFPASLPSGNILNRPVSLISSAAYITRMTANGSAQDWSLFIGGTARQAALDLKRDGLGNVYLLGATSSPNFPVTSGAYKTRIASSDNDLFVVKIDGVSGRILASTFLGISPRADLFGLGTLLAVDFAGGIYVTGGIYDDSFKPTPGTLPVPTYTGDGSVFILRLNASATAAVYVSNFPVGGISTMEVDAAGNLVVGGTPYRNTPFAPVNPIPGIDPGNGFLGAFVAKVNATASAILFSSLLQGHNGGAGIEDIKIDGSGNIYVLGNTSGDSFPQVNPLATNPAASAPGSDTNTAWPFLVKLSPAGNALLQSTWLRSASYIAPFAELGEPPQQLILRPNGLPCIVNAGSRSFVQSPGGLTGTDFYTPFANTATTNLSCVNANSTALDLNTGIPAVIFNSAASTPDDAVIFAGTGSFNLTTTPGAFQSTFGGGFNQGSPSYAGPSDAYIMRVSLQNPSPAATSVFPNFLLITGAVQNNLFIDLYGSGFAFGTAVQWNGQPVTSAFETSLWMTLSVPPSMVQAGANRITLSLPGPGGGSSEIDFQGINAAPGTLSISPLTITAGASETKLVIRGTNISAGSILNWNGVPRAASFVVDPPNTSGHLELILEPSELAQPASTNVTVTNPAPGGGTSPPAVFAIQAAGATPPALTNHVVTFGSGTVGPQIQFAGRNFSDGIRAFWDGNEIPATAISSTIVGVTPPAQDLQHIANHSLYVQVGTLASNTIPVMVGFDITTSPASVIDPSGTLVYALSSTSFASNALYDLLTFDLASGTLVSRVASLVPQPIAMAISDDGAFVYIGAIAPPGAMTVYRYNTASASVDLTWTVAPPVVSSGLTQAILTVPGSPEMVVVAWNGVLSIYDRDQKRPADTFLPVLTVVQGTPVFVTSSRILLNSGGSIPCWTWVDFDGLGVESVQNSCASAPPGLMQDGVLSYLTDGTRVKGVSLAGTSTTAAVVAVDLAGRKAYSPASQSQITQFNLDTAAQTPRSFLGGGSGPTDFFVSADGQVFVRNAGQLFVLP